jgi:uncharacterized protein (DUF58 family)
MNRQRSSLVTDSGAPLLGPALLSRLEHLTIGWRSRATGHPGGILPSRHTGAGSDFLDHRQLYPGDDLRAVNWRAYLRFERLFLKLFHMEPQAPVRILIDTSASMSAGYESKGTEKFRLALQVAAAIAYVGLLQLDSVVVQPFAGGLTQPVAASGGRYRYPVVEQALKALTPGGETEFAAVVQQFLTRYPQPGLAIVVSDFLAEWESVRKLEWIAAQAHELILLQVWSMEDRAPSAEGELELIDAETGARLQLLADAGTREAHTRAFDEHGERLSELAARAGGRYAAIPAHFPLEQSVLSLASALHPR